MSLFFRDKNFYLLNVFGIAGCGITLAPSLVEFSDRSWKSLRKKPHYPRFVLGSDESGRELSIEATGLINGSGGGRDSVSFSDIVMNWGYYRLQAHDFLISCEGNEYYIARHVWDNWYRLDNGKRFVLTEDICNGNKKDGAKTISLAFKKTSGSGQPSKLQIMAKSCNFKKNDTGFAEKEQWSWNMECKVEKENTGTGGTGAECVTLSINKSNYKLEYKRERKSTER